MIINQMLKFILKNGMLSQRKQNNKLLIMLNLFSWI